MPIVFRNVTVVLEEATGRRDVRRTETFPTRVRAADAAIKGFSLDYAKKDHHINVIAVDVDILNVEGNDVEFLVQAMYADKKNDDPYLGFVNVLVIADVDPPSGTELPEVPNPPILGS